LTSNGPASMFLAAGLISFSCVKHMHKPGFPVPVFKREVGKMKLIAKNLDYDHLPNPAMSSLEMCDS